MDIGGEGVDSETALPDATGPRFWLKSATWEIPTFDNVETFVRRLAHEDALRLDPAVQSVLQGDPPSLSPRTLRHRFLHATGMTQKQIQQMARARRAADLLQQGTPILDAVAGFGFVANWKSGCRCLRHRVDLCGFSTLSTPERYRRHEDFPTPRRCHRAYAQQSF